MGFPGDFLGSTLPDSRHERPAPQADAARRADAWIPIRSLGPRHRRRMAAHLLSLDESDRYLRFGYAASNEQIENYVERIDFLRDEVFGVFNRRLELIALTHLAHLDGGSSAEFGVSVLANYRGRGLGARLFGHAVLHARNRGVDTLIIHALSENRAMLKIARNAGAIVERDGGEAQALLKLPPEDFASRVGQLVEDRAAELDYQLKVQARRMDELLLAFAQVREELGKTGRNAGN